jgi:hypothetical protein
MRLRPFLVIFTGLLYVTLFFAPYELVHAQALPAPSITSFLSTVVLQKIKQLQFAANDPRIVNTLDSMSAEAESLAQSTATAAGSSSVPWASILSRGAVGLGLLATPTALGDDTLVAWQVNHDGTITATQVSSSPSGGASGASAASSSSAGSSTPALNTSGKFFFASWNGVLFQAVTADAVFVNILAAVNAFSHLSPGYVETSCTVVQGGNGREACGASVPGSTLPTFTASISVSNGDSSGLNCPSGSAVGGVCTSPPAGAGDTGSGSGGSQVWTGTADSITAAQNVAKADEGQALNPLLVADLADSLWSSAASQPGYNGIPYPADSPVTQQDVDTARQGNPQSYPDVSDLTTPVSDPAGAANPFALPVPTPSSDPASSSQPASAPSSNPSGNSQSDLGPDPGVGTPTLEQTPTAQQILQPVLNMLPDLRNYGLPAHSSQCPEPSITVFGTTLRMTSQCDLTSQFRPQIYGTFALAFTLAALFIILTA